MSNQITSMSLFFLTLCNCGESKTSEYESKSLYKLKLFYWVEMIWTNTKRHEMYIIYI